MKQKLNRWLRYHAPHIPSFLPKDWRGRYYAWKYIEMPPRPLTPEEIRHGQELWKRRQAAR